MPTKDRFSLSAWIEESVRDFAKSPENSLRNKENEPAFDMPLVGFSSGADPLYGKLKEMIGPFFWTPLEIFRRTFPDLWITADQLTVISWVLPMTRATKADTRKEKVYASERWYRARRFGEEFNVKLRNHVAAKLTEAGYQAVAPQLSPAWSIKTSEKYGIASCWSERHAAFVSGLGTFGLCDGLITPVGKAMRCGSVIARLSVPPTPRPYDDYHAYCLFFTQGQCGKCIGRCPVGAITEAGHDKLKCKEYVDTVQAAHAREAYGLEAYGCGLCQTKVPCESRIPSVKAKDEPV
jgi:epoxyqueuosine reductase QueG